MVKILPTKLQDVKLIETDVFGDNRGFFTEAYTRNKFEEIGIDFDFNQDNHSLSAEAGVLRGLHYQLAPYTQTKLVRVATGVVWDVLVDMRKGSPTYGEWEGYLLSEYNHRQLLVPRGFAHGFITLTPNVNFLYKVDGYYEPKADRGIAFDDPQIDITWPISMQHLIMSDKDKRHPSFNDAENNFIYGEI
ncbi:dTDP-4-dehydrorhamnose 3,5-epimerase [Periweissella ghanensis]|uniref:dTDP-4-dehydrorhamnose 3,5-epimerase n=1 Tax=Periweissella ghanensis TaxID=467997 RepID=A0ABN8BSC5_9LACO|nr:dTDP-4-dehydrorhamnose 3,5-epimerase [Periweissella ghanensis]MCM0600247.1 dTDP-4-dehydrorhamnose 3,5-epimerase [Periweissella ghanensis]CAH0419121.1 dTDP-4-dehydrorhamnose 3,5-epimerase [Periweissella ghanensis]